MLLSRKDGDGVIAVDLSALPEGASWLRDLDNDVAARIVPLPPGHAAKAVGIDRFADDEDLVPGRQCFTIGCPYGLRGVDPTRATPLVLDGVVSGFDPEHKSLYLSVPTFPGNSGGPVLLAKVPFDPAGNLIVGQPTLLLGGIVRETAELSPEGQVPLRLGIAAPASTIRRLLSGPAADRQRNLVGSLAAAETNTNG